MRFGGSWQHVELATIDLQRAAAAGLGATNGDPIGGDFGDFDIIGSRYRAFELNAGWSLRQPRSHALPDDRRAPPPVAFHDGSGQRGRVRSRADYDYAAVLPHAAAAHPNRIPLRFHTHVELRRGARRHDRGAAESQLLSRRPGFGARLRRIASLGPRDSLGNPYGGDLALSGQIEAILPIPREIPRRARAPRVFFDFGQDYDLGDTKFTDKAGFPADYSFDLGRAARLGRHRRRSGSRRSACSDSATRFPLRYRKATELDYGDDIEGFQF